VLSHPKRPPRRTFRVGHKFFSVGPRTEKQKQVPVRLRSCDTDGRTSRGLPPIAGKIGDGWGTPFFAGLKEAQLGSGSPRSPNARDRGHPFLCDGARPRKAKAGPHSTQIVRHGRTNFAGPPTHRRKNRRWMGHPIFCWVERGALGSGSPRSPNARDLGHPFFCDGARYPTHRAMELHDGWGLPW
jgi:hypothetical protein